MEQLRLSPSSIITYMRCPREFYYSYIKRLPTPLNIHLIKGTLVHTVLEKFFGKHFRPDFEVFSEELFYEAFKEKEEDWMSLKLSEEENSQHQEDCLNMIRLYMLQLRLKIDFLKQIGKVKGDRHGFYTLRPKLKEVWLEDKELGLCGYIDRIHTDWDGKVTIGDYKTSSRYGIGMKSEYELQDGLYALLYKRCKNKMADYASIIYLRYGEEVMTRVTPDLVNHALKTVQFVRDNTKTKEIENYQKKECNFCKWCNWFKICSGIQDKEQELKMEKTIKELKDAKAKQKETNK